MDYDSSILVKKIQLPRYVRWGIKRGIDFFVAVILLIVLSPIFILVAFCILICDGRPIFYQHHRLGQYEGKKFRNIMVYKFRTMKSGVCGTQITSADDSRITRIGKILRRMKLDELPQLFNVFDGTMSFVGPRPDVERYVNSNREIFATLLYGIRPGITGKASISFIHEEDQLSEAVAKQIFFLATEGNMTKAIELAYCEEILPKKLELEMAYVKNISFCGDMKILVMTVLFVIIRCMVPARIMEARARS